MPRKPSKRMVPPAPEPPEPEEVATEFALASDGCIYVEEKAIDAKGRDVFRGFAATAEEATRAVEALHCAAFNITVEVFARKRAA